MLRKYYIHNFKNHANTSLDLGGLTILTGMNGMGKSSVLQSMLLLRESFMKTPQMQELALDGESFSIGQTAGLVNRNVTEDQNILKIEMAADEGDISFTYVYPDGDANVLELLNDEMLAKAELLRTISLFNDDFQYLSAFRMGPQPIYGSHTNVVDKHRQLSQKMGMGEYAVYYLNKFGRDLIPIPALAYEDSNSLTLYQQTELWMGDISEGIRFRIDQNGNQFDLKYGYEQPGRPTTYHSALNTGFGVSYILAVLVAVLSAKPGSLVIIENPEAHCLRSGGLDATCLIGCC